MNKKITTKDLTRIGLLTALAVVLKFFTVTLGVSRKYNLVALPMMLAGIFYGPLAGGITGALGDFVGYLVLPQGAFHPGFTLTGFIIGFGSGVISKYIFKNRYESRRVAISFLCAAFSYLGAKLFLDTLWVVQLSGASYKVIFLGRLLKVTIETIVNFAILYLLLPRLSKTALK